MNKSDGQRFQISICLPSTLVKISYLCAPLRHRITMLCPTFIRREGFSFLANTETGKCYFFSLDVMMDCTGKKTFEEIE